MQPQPSVADGIRTVIKVEVRGNKAGQTGFPHVDVQVLRFRRAEEGSCDRQVCDLFSQKVWNDQLSPLFITTSKTWQLQNKLLTLGASA